MASQIFINLPVTDLNKAMDLYLKMGFTNNPTFSDETAKCMVWSEHIFVMLMINERFATFATKPISNIKNSVAAMYSLSLENLDAVNKAADNAVAAGAKETVPFKDYGFMQQRTIEDLDGHTWEIFTMDMSKFPTA